MNAIPIMVNNKPIQQLFFDTAPSPTQITCGQQPSAGPHYSSTTLFHTQDGEIYEMDHSASVEKSLQPSIQFADTKFRVDRLTRSHVDYESPRLSINFGNPDNSKPRDPMSQYQLCSNPQRHR